MKCYACGGEIDSTRFGKVSDPKTLTDLASYHAARGCDWVAKNLKKVKQTLASEGKK